MEPGLVMFSHFNSDVVYGFDLLLTSFRTSYEFLERFISFLRHFIFERFWSTATVDTCELRTPAVARRESTFDIRYTCDTQY